MKERAGIMLTRSAKAESKAKRHSDLTTILETRRSELMHDVQHKIRDVRSDGITERDVLDEAESSEVYTQGRHRICVDSTEGGDDEQD
jgi:hypothetical protein